ncbi:MAG: type II toxin-antitoxin system PemK/MazF family toxin [Candidatus Gracilibacteria bacterium]
MKIQQGDLVLVPFPYSDLSSVKTRPALVVSNSSLRGEDCILCGVTSQRGKQPQVVLGMGDLLKGSLPLTSYIRADKMISLKKDIIRRVVAQISGKKQEEVFNKISDLLSVE